MIEITRKEAHLVWPLLQTLRYDNVLDALIHGYHGTMTVDDLDKPTVFLGWVGFVYFLAGNPNSVKSKQMIQGIPKGVEINTTAAWVKVLEENYPKHIQKITRYAFAAEHLDKTHLSNVASGFQKDYTIAKIDERYYHQIIRDQWGLSFVSNFKDYRDYQAHGLGFVVLKNDIIVAGASSYAYFNGGYEIEIITHKDYRNQGLATAIGAHFCLACLQTQKIPSWDAANLTSKRLADRLGFTFEYSYDVFIINA